MKITVSSRPIPGKAKPPASAESYIINLGYARVPDSEEGETKYNLQPIEIRDEARGGGPEGDER